MADGTTTLTRSPTERDLEDAQAEYDLACDDFETGHGSMLDCERKFARLQGVKL